MKIVFDTNVYIAQSLLGKRSSKIINASKKARWKVFSSQYLLDELERVLSEKFEFTGRLAVVTRERVAMTTVTHEPPPSRHHVPGDPKDNPILQLAVSAGCDYLVTDDKVLLGMSPYQGLQIVSMREFEQILRNQGLLSR